MGRIQGIPNRRCCPVGSLPLLIYVTNIIAHNSVDPNNYERGYRSGALLTVDLLRDVFEWLNSGLLLKGVQVQVRQHELLKHKHPAADNGLFLSFMSNTRFGRVRQHSGTKFDWMLVEVSNHDYYALSVAGEMKWLKFDTTAKKYQGVELSEIMDGKGCLFLNLADNDCAWVILAVGTGFVENGVEKKVKLRIQGTHIKTYDVERESSEVSLVPNLGCEGRAPVRIVELFIPGLLLTKFMTSFLNYAFGEPFVSTKI